MRIAWPASTVLLLTACSTVAPLDTEAMSSTTGEADAETSAETLPTSEPDVGSTSLASASLTEPTADPTTTPPSSSDDGTTGGVDDTGGETTSQGMTTLQETTQSTDSESDSNSASTAENSTGEPAPGCDNGLQDPEETDLDCGGPCSPCDDGQACLDNPDCNSGVCTDLACAAASCDDGVQNQDETDVDCGGSTCDKCLDGETCVDSGDCESGVCDGDICLAPTCEDNALNQDETSVDCGGAACEPCGDGQSCLVADDCSSGVCDNDVCAPATCTDSVQNGDETGVDCGSMACAPCELPGLVLNEVDYDNVGTDNAEFVEVYNNTGADVDLANIRLYVVNGSNNNVLTTVNLAPAGVLAQGQYLVVGPPGLPIAMGALKVDFAKAADNLQNDLEGLALVDVGGPTVLDVLSYEGSITMANLPNLVGTSLVEGMAFAGADSNTTQRSLARFPTGNDKNNAATDWLLSKLPTPGAANGQ